MGDKKERKAVAAAAEAAGGVGEQQQKGEFAIVPSSVTPALDASNWPLLLRNYDRLNVRGGIAAARVVFTSPAALPALRPCVGRA